MFNKSVFCLTTSRPQAEQIVDRLKAGHFANSAISVLFADHAPAHVAAGGKSHQAPADQHAKAQAGAVTGTAAPEGHCCATAEKSATTHPASVAGAAKAEGTCCAGGGTLGALTGIGALTLPGAGPLVASGPVKAALTDATGASPKGGIAGGLIGLGITELQANQFATGIKAGNILVSVHTTDPAQFTLANSIFKEKGAQGICVTGESGAKDRPTEKSAAPPAAKPAAKPTPKPALVGA